VYDVPDVQDGDGFYVALGGRSNTFSYELGYQRTVHDTSSSFVDIGDSTATYNVVDMNMRFDVFARQQIRPYLLAGIGFTWIDIDDSSTDGFTYDDETFSGFALNAGAGIAYYMLPQWALTAGIVYRWNWYDSVESKDLDDDLKERALGFTAGMTYTF
jgi:opacity protein-like surface antigen